MSPNLWIDVAGWAGVVALLTAYGLVSARRLEGDSVAYQLLNLAGGALVLLNSFHYRAFPSVAVNVVWIGIAFYTLVSRRRRG
ncbi:MAG: CBU_0592 family membrane protein [Chloroflexia bacterium]